MKGDEFREDRRRARAWLSPEELAPLTTLSNTRGALSVLQTLLLLACSLALPWWVEWRFGHGLWVLPLSWLWTATQLHALFILAHEAAHYRLFSHRGLNDAVGRALGGLGGVSMCTYRVTHRLHHNHLYGPQDPDTALHGGYPRGVAYLWRKLGQDLLGLNAWKTFAYFFGAPAVNDDTGQALRPLDDTAPHLKAAARRDRWWVLACQVALPLGCLAWAGAWGVLAYGVLWLVPLLCVLQPILRLRAVFEHGAVPALDSPLKAARCNLTGRSRSGRPLDTALNTLARALLFPHHVNHHLEHHLYPAVPHYRLPRLHRLLNAKGALHGAEVRDVRDTWHRVFAART